MGLTGVSSCLAGREWILLSSLSHHVLFRRHVGLLTGGCSTRGRFPIPTHQQLAPRSPFTSFQPAEHQYPKGYWGGNWEKTHSPPTQGVQTALTLPHTTNCLWVSPSPKGSVQSVRRDVQSGGLNRESVSGSGAPPFLLPTPSPREAHARSLGQRPSLSWTGRVGEKEHCPPLDGSETWDEADTKIREY